MDEEAKIRMQKQLRASLKWLQNLGIETKYQQELMGILKNQTGESLKCISNILFATAECS